MVFRKIVSWGTVAIVGGGGGQGVPVAIWPSFAAAGDRLPARDALPASVPRCRVGPV